MRKIILDLKIFAALLALGAVGLSTRPAAAQSGFALNRFEPAERGSDWFSLESLDLRGHLRPAVGLTLDWAYRPLIIYNADGSERAALVRHQFFSHAGASLVLWQRVRFGINLPVAWVDAGDSGRIGATVLNAPNHVSFGDIRLGADVRLWGKYGDVVTLAGGLQAFLPTGSRDGFTGDGGVRLVPRVMVSGRVDWFEYAAKLGVLVRTAGQTFAGAPVGSEIMLGASAGARFWNKALLVGPELNTSSVLASGFLQRRTTPLELTIGAHYTFLRDFRVGLGVGPGMTRGYGSPTLRTLASFEWAPAYRDHPPGDRDHDGINDEDDRCPDQPGPSKTDGCPDRDGDGVADRDDACPDVPGERTRDKATNGCPPDRDHDGVIDSEDACVDVPGVRTRDKATNGCPPDRDRDGVPDSEDACVDKPGVKTGDKATNGCPPDRDGDKIYDPDDACPDSPGPANPDPVKNGCPPARIEHKQIKILEQVKFETNSAKILPESDMILSAVAKALADNPQIKKLRVDGHTDDRGSATFNKDLSRRRAASVVKWLVSHGIATKRLTSAGYGKERPIDSNQTERGRYNNRRVEFHIIEVE